MLINSRLNGFKLHKTRTQVIQYLQVSGFCRGCIYFNPLVAVNCTDIIQEFADKFYGKLCG